MLLHKPRDHNCGRSADPCVTVHQDPATLCESVIQEAMTGGKVLLQVRSRTVQLTDPLVGVLLRELGVEARSHRQDMRDAVSTQDVLVVGGDVIPQKEPLNDFVQRLNPVLLTIHFFSEISIK